MLSKVTENGPIQAIRAVIRKIPRGKVSSYGAVAEAAGIRRGARVAVRALQGAVDLPWHRVVASGGRIALQGDSAFEQRFRLESEGVRFAGKRVPMAEFEHKFKRKAASTTGSSSRKNPRKRPA